MFNERKARERSGGYADDEAGYVNLNTAASGLNGQ